MTNFSYVGFFQQTLILNPRKKKYSKKILCHHFYCFLLSVPTPKLLLILSVIVSNVLRHSFLLFAFRSGTPFKRTNFFVAFKLPCMCKVLLFANNLQVRVFFLKRLLTTCVFTLVFVSCKVCKQLLFFIGLPTPYMC